MLELEAVVFSLRHLCSEASCAPRRALVYILSPRKPLKMPPAIHPSAGAYLGLILAGAVVWLGVVLGSEKDDSGASLIEALYYTLRVSYTPKELRLRFHRLPIEAQLDRQLDEQPSTAILE